MFGVSRNLGSDALADSSRGMEIKDFKLKAQQSR
jgi:hypothetical protein